MPDSAAEDVGRRDVVPGTTWRHFKGATYEVIELATLVDGPLEGRSAVVYIREDDAFGEVFVRTLTNWHEIVVGTDGQAVHRFSPKDKP